MWSGPRNLSTAMMYSFAARGDCGIWDEPFYAAYLKATGIDHPMRAEILAAHETDASVIADRCSGEAPLGEPIFYQKHMTLHMIPSFDRGFMRDCENVFLIRHPTRVVASYAKKREGPSLADIGFVQQAKLFDEVAQWLGRPPLVVDSADVRQDPKGMLTALCAALGLPLHRGHAALACGRTQGRRRLGAALVRRRASLFGLRGSRRPAAGPCPALCGPRPAGAAALRAPCRLPHQDVKASTSRTSASERFSRPRRVQR